MSIGQESCQLYTAHIMFIVRLLLLGVAGFWASSAIAQTVRARAPKPAPRVVVPVKPKQLQPLDCEAYQRAAGVPWARAVCEQTNYDFIDVYARHYGMPKASAEVISIPAHGTGEAKRYGVACMQGLAMKRLPNGWEQLRDRQGNYMRCRDL